MPAIHDFGLFMALIVGSCWLTVFCTIPPALFLWHCYIEQCEALIFQSIFGWISCSGGSGLPGKHTLSKNVLFGYWMKIELLKETGSLAFLDCTQSSFQSFLLYMYC